MIHYCLAVFCTAVVGSKTTKLVEHRVSVCEDVAVEAIMQNVDPVLAVSVAWRESSLLRNAKSSKGAVGPMQVLPRFWCKEKRCNLVKAGIDALKYYTTRYGTRPGLCAYFSGKTCSRSSKSSDRYQRSVMQTYNEFMKHWDVPCGELGC